MSSSLGKLAATGSLDLDLDLDPELLDLLGDASSVDPQPQSAPVCSEPPGGQHQHSPALQQQQHLASHSQPYVLPPMAAGPWGGFVPQAQQAQQHHAHYPGGHMMPPGVVMGAVPYPNPAWMTPFVIPNRGLPTPPPAGAGILGVPHPGQQQEQQQHHHHAGPVRQMAMAMGCWGGASELVMGGEGGGENKAASSASTPAGETDESTQQHVKTEVKGGSGGDRTAALLKRQAAIQAKNRRAQKRFRERQKAKMANLEVQVDDLYNEVDDLKTENSSLLNQNRLLSKVLQLKDQQMCVLQETVKVMERGGSNRKDEPQLSAEVLDSLPSTEGMVICRDSETAVSRLANILPASKFLNMTEAELKHLWKDYVHQLSALMIQAGDSKDQTTIEQEVPRVLEEMGELCCKTATICPKNMTKLLIGSFEVPEKEQTVEDPNLDNLWSEVLASLEVSDEQSTKMVELRSTFLSRMKTLWQQRSSLNKKFQEHIEVMEGKPLPGTQVTCGVSAKISEIVEDLRDSLHREMQYHYDYINTFFCEVLDHKQVARAFVHSYPYYPDILAMSNICAQKMGGKAE